MAVQGYGQIDLKVEQPGGDVRQLTLNRVTLASGAPINLLANLLAVGRACDNIERMFRIGSKVATIESGEETIPFRREGADLYKMKGRGHLRARSARRKCRQQQQQRRQLRRGSAAT